MSTESPPTEPPITEPPTTKPKPRRKRKTKAEKEAERMAKMAAEADKPIDPQIWLTLGGILLLLGVCIYVDPVGFADASQQTRGTTWIQVILEFAVAFAGKNPTAAVLSIIGLLSLGWGIRGWLRQYSAMKPGRKD
jgi:hypothetical protein